MSFYAIGENKILAKISEFTVFKSLHLMAKYTARSCAIFLLFLFSVYWCLMVCGGYVVCPRFVIKLFVSFIV